MDALLTSRRKSATSSGRFARELRSFVEALERSSPLSNISDARRRRLRCLGFVLEDILWRFAGSRDWPLVRSFLAPSPLAGEGRGGGLRATTRRLTSEIASLLDRHSFDPTDYAAGALSPLAVDSAVAALTVGRHRSGAFDTPPAVAAFMCRQAIEGCLNDREGNGTFADLKFVDPAVGCGAFLIELFDQLNAPGTSAMRAPRGQPVADCLYGADVDADAGHVARLRLWLRQAATSDEPPDGQGIARRIIVGDSLMGIDWPTTFPEVFTAERGGFDAVLANPPYLRQELIDPRTKARLLAAFSDGASGFSDLCCYFYLLGLR
ncbi:MAG: N-6 DNA methylase, partial [Planctomycetia bacterium]|nr:N-6 DNA methylase [Planctomycetia bacterium]